MSNAIELEDFWCDDKLERQGEAEYLSRFLSSRFIARPDEPGFVIAINADWGMGKSHMLERWGKQLRHTGYPVVHFDAWSNDFSPEPLVAFIAELDRELSPVFSKVPALKKYRRQFLEVSKGVLAAGAKTIAFAAVKKATGFAVSELADQFQSRDSTDADDNIDENRDDSNLDSAAISSELKKAVEGALNAHKATKKAIAAFKAKLTMIVKALEAESTIQLPVFIFVDELDRCRPDYAIELLEGIKHLFGVPGIYFVVATNLPQLGHSVRAIYGQGFAADRYLKRFFDICYTLPFPNGLAFASELMSSIVNPNLNMTTGFEHVLESQDDKHLPKIFMTYVEGFQLGFRCQQDAARVLEATFLSLPGKVHVHLVVFLTVLCQKWPDLFADLARTGQLPNRDDYEDFYSHTMNAFFEVPNFSDDDAPFSRTPQKKKKVSLLDVFEVYLTALNGEKLSGGVPYNDFPNNLTLEFPKPSIGNGKQWPVKYFEVVQRAGGFSN
jgi:hypothetical protein